MSSNQHGFRPGRGTLTAWRDILGRAINKPDIYEFDYKGFFDSVSSTKVLSDLRQMGLPKIASGQLYHIVKSVPQLREVDEMPEPDRVLRYNSRGEVNVNYLGRPGLTAAQLHPEIPRDLMVGMMYEDMADLDGVPLEWVLSNYETVYKKYLEYQWAALSSFNPDQPLPFAQPEQQYPKEFGFPQGAPISPLLSILPLSLLDRHVNLHRDRVRYADDFIEFPRGGPTAQWQRLPGNTAMMKMPKAFSDYGISYSAGKCG